jgi:hypothetical protein
MSLNASTDAPLTVAVASPRSSDSATAALITRIAERDPRAINEFYRLYRRRILAVALRVVGNEWDAEEVLQDVVWVVFRKVEGFSRRVRVQLLAVPRDPQLRQDAASQAQARARAHGER